MEPKAPASRVKATKVVVPDPVIPKGVKGPTGVPGLGRDEVGPTSAAVDEHAGHYQGSPGAQATGDSTKMWTPPPPTDVRPPRAAPK